MTTFDQARLAMGGGGGDPSWSPTPHGTIVTSVTIVADPTAPRLTDHRDYPSREGAEAEALKTLQWMARRIPDQDEEGAVARLLERISATDQPELLRAALIVEGAATILRAAR
jgi:hypothetical protein